MGAMNTRVDCFVKTRIFPDVSILSQTTAKSFKLIQSEFEKTVWSHDRHRARGHTSNQRNEVNREPIAKKTQDTKSASLEEAVTKLACSAEAQETTSNEG